MKKQILDLTRAYKEAVQGVFTEQKKCFNQLFKFEAGMTCLACDASYDKFVTANPDGSYTVKIHNNVCVRLKTACYSYLQRQKKLGETMLESIKITKLVEGQKEIQSRIEAVDAAVDSGDQEAIDAAKTELQTLRE